ncbi:DUF885 domain-containing protein [Coralloluteibacterium stylophorae]|uniref:DUF885 domain-containing protein n=1 Tax=Coralloluteibacterium stylophorae TaxID=1776034 RepID=A0A8J8AWH2_9GAMM|nr:DUF885 domain-containing protein [Coralloluteibacterium stylophorae]MBS7456866.1 DUF885 domain-containing protein [Coralloluteibacterium stylophorae]
MRRVLVVSALTLALSAAWSSSVSAQAAAPAAPATAQAASEDARLNAWFERKYEEQLQFSPIQMTFLGRKDRYGELDDMSRAAADRQLAWQVAALEEMTSTFDYDALSDATRLSWDLFEYQVQEARAAHRFADHAYPFEQMGGMQAQLPTFMIGFHKVETEADYEAYVARLREVPRAFGQLMDQARRSAEKGIRPPRFAHEGVIEQGGKVIDGAPFTEGEDSALWADAQAKADALVEAGTIDAARAAELKAQARAALVEAVKPAYDEVIGWFRADLPNALENPSGVGTTHPDGAAYYAQRLRASTTTDLTAEQVHRIGLDEVARIRGEMEALKDKVGFEGDLQAFFQFMRSDPRFKYPNTDAGRQAYLDDATKALDTIEQHLPEYFGLLPKADLVVKRVEAFREVDGAAQHYYPSTPDGSRPGIYYAHLSDMDAMPKTELEVIAYHEGLPGHHMQIAIAQELEGVPEFRKQAGFTAYAEGWALYSEWLAREMPGTYTDPYSEFGRLTSEMWRAIRLVVDTGLHAKGWTQDQAVAYFEENSSVPREAIEAEVRRYITWPGQATAYKIGMIRIQELRAKAEAELGNDFDIRRFHDAVLGGGALPLTLLERRIEQWIAEEKKRG